MSRSPPNKKNLHGNLFTKNRFLNESALMILCHARSLQGFVEAVKGKWCMDPKFDPLNFKKRPTKPKKNVMFVCVCSHASMDFNLKKTLQNAGGNHQSKGSKCNNRTMRSSYWQPKLQTLLGAVFLLGTWIQMQRAISKCLISYFLSKCCCMKCDQSSPEASASLHQKKLTRNFCRQAFYYYCCL